MLFRVWLRSWGKAGVEYDKEKVQAGKDNLIGVDATNTKFIHLYFLLPYDIMLLLWK